MAEFLPDEVLEYILEDSSVRMSDVLTFGSTCKQLYRRIYSNNKLWRTKFFQRWPFLKETYESNAKLGIKPKNWIEETKANILTGRKLLDLISQMSAKYYRKQQLSTLEFQEYETLFAVESEAHPMAYHFIICELMRIIEKPVVESNLTHTYYALKVIRYFKQEYVSKEWLKFRNLPLKEQTLEKGAVIVAQWSQPERQIPYSYVSNMLDNLAEETKALILEQNPSHPLSTVSSERVDAWKVFNIEDHYWSDTSATKHVIRALGEVMFNRHGFHGNSEMYYSSENLFIDRVLERRRGNPLTLAIIFESVARRLGVRCEPVIFPSHFLLRFKESYTAKDSANTENFYIDVCDIGKIVTKKNCPQVGGFSRCPIERYNVHLAATTIEVVEKMGNNLEVAGRQRTHLNGRAARLRSALELLHMVRRNDTNVILQLARFYMLHQMDLTELVNLLTQIHETETLQDTVRGQANHILRMLQDFQRHMKVGTEEEVKPKTRVDNVKFAIGLIMKHRTYGYHCVITGWDPCCVASQQWMNEMGVDELSVGPEQPFYNVFANDGSSRYAAQENLVIATTPEWVNHEEIGRYFCQFKRTHYVPNEEKAREYPEDELVRDRLLNETYSINVKPINF